jgi:hypothetical protein
MQNSEVQLFPEDGGDRFLQIIGKHLYDYTGS